MLATDTRSPGSAVTSPPLVSIIIPAYNAASFIDDALASLQQQTFAGWECICIDDGSTDGTAAAIESWAASDPRIRCIRQSNAGPGAARNRGLRESASRYYGFLDADDALRPDALDRLLHITRSHDAAIGVVSYEPFSGTCVPSYVPNPRASEVSVFDAPILPRLVRPNNFRFHVWGKLYDADRIGDVFFPEAYAGPEDTFFTVATYARAQRVAITDEPLYLYRSRPESLSRKAARSQAYIAGSCDVALLCDTLCRQQKVAPGVSRMLLRIWGTNRIFTELLEAAAAKDVDDSAFFGAVDAARTALQTLTERIGSLRSLISPQHIPTYIAGVKARSRPLLSLLATLRRLRQLIKSTAVGSKKRR